MVGRYKRSSVLIFQFQLAQTKSEELYRFLRE